MRDILCKQNWPWILVVHKIRHYIIFSPVNKSVLKQNFSSITAFLLKDFIRFSSTLDSGMMKFKPKVRMTRVINTRKTVYAAFSKSVSCTSIGRNSTRQPILLWGGGGLNLIVCQLVDCIFWRKRSTHLNLRYSSRYNKHKPEICQDCSFITGIIVTISVIELDLKISFKTEVFDWLISEHIFKFGRMVILLLRHNKKKKVSAKCLSIKKAKRISNFSSFMKDSTSTVGTTIENDIQKLKTLPQSGRYPPRHFDQFSH